jgi:hypothetical protein
MRTRLGLTLVVVALLASGCSGLAGTPPPPTPADFAGIVSYLTAEGIGVSGVQTGGAGCDDRQLVGPAISLTASGLDQAQPVPVHLYLFKNAAAYDKLRPSVDACAQAYVTDPSTYESVDASPFVAVGQGPWGAGFRAAVQAALTKAAGGR